MKFGEPTAALGVAGLACFQLVSMWNANAPTLQDMRTAPAGDLTCKQQLLDADFLVGGLATLVGVFLAIATKDMTALILLLVTFGLVSIWYHQVLAAESR